MRTLAGAFFQLFVVAVSMGNLVFFRIGWMKDYNGRTSADPIINGGTWPDKGEVFNFSAYKSQHYGYVQPSRTASGVTLQRIKAGFEGDRLADVTVVWLANRPGGGSFIVGWYQNATVFSALQSAPATAARDYGNGNIGYFTKAKASDCRLLDLDERRFEIPRGKNHPGRSNIFYSDSNPALMAAVLKYIKTGKIPTDKKDKVGLRRQPDVFKRMAVEKAAIETVANHYKSLGYEVESVERDNIGWDLTAISGRLSLNLEVKGLSGPDIIAELTPNEYRHLSKKSLNYRLCIVCNALTNPILHIFAYDNDTSTWQSQHNLLLQLEERVSARASA